jgi:hypothetical protein
MDAKMKKYLADVIKGKHTHEIKKQIFNNVEMLVGFDALAL